MTTDPSQHVFVSYVREDSDQVDALCEVLKAAQIPYWRDRTSLAPGDAWKTKIRQAIQHNALVFLACFSDRSRAREKSTMNEELTLAVEEFRKMPPGRPWLIPVRFDDGPVPEWELGAGRLLSDLNYADLFDPGYAPQAAALVTTIHGLMGGNQASASTTLASVEEAAEEDRAAILRRLTKAMLPDPARRIELDDLISQEVRHITAAMQDAERFQVTVVPSDPIERAAMIAETANSYWKLVEPFCYSLQAASRWATPDQLQPWVAGLRALADEATRLQNGITLLLEVRHVISVAAVMVAGLASTASNRWDNLRTLVAEPTIRDRMHSRGAIPLIEATSPWQLPDDGKVSMSTLARAASSGEDFATAAAMFTERRVGVYHTPVAEWLHTVLRPLFDEQLPTDNDYDDQFDRAEVMIGVIGQHLASERYASNPNVRFLARSQWFGRSTWRSRYPPTVVEELAAELGRDGAGWGPLRGGLFDSNPDKARVAIQEYGESFTGIAQTQH